MELKPNGLLVKVAKVARNYLKLIIPAYSV